MDEAITQLLAQRFGATPEETVALQSGDVSALLANRFPEPLAAALMSSMMRANSDGETEEEDPRYQRMVVRAREVIRELKTDLAAADATINYIAEIFGSCPVCLGQSESCTRCAGKGQPGSAPPLANELLAWVNPALKRLGMRVIRIQ